MDANASDSDGLVVAGAKSAPTPIRSRARCAAAVATIGTCVAWLVVDSEMLCCAELVSLAADVAMPALAASGLFVLGIAIVEWHLRSAREAASEDALLLRRSQANKNLKKP